jgi:acetyl esterase/lipase
VQGKRVFSEKNAHSPLFRTFSASWIPEQIAAVAAFRSGIAETDVVKVRNAMAQAPPAAHPETVSVRPVMISRIPVPGLEDSASGQVKAEWLEPKTAVEDAPVVIYLHGGGKTWFVFVDLKPF